MNNENPSPVTYRQPAPWERQEKETNKAWNAFCLYRDMNPAERTVDKVRQKCKLKCGTHLTRWCSDHDWVIRAGSYDAHMDELRRSQRERERLAASDRRIQIARNMQAIGGAKIQELGKGIQQAIKDGKPLPRISLKDATAIINAGVQIERLESGESTSNLAIEGMILIEDAMKREREIIELVKEAIRAESDPKTTQRIVGYIEARCIAKRD